MTTAGGFWQTAETLTVAVLVLPPKVALRTVEAPAVSVYGKLADWWLASTVTLAGNVPVLAGVVNSVTAVSTSAGMSSVTVKLAEAPGASEAVEGDSVTAAGSAPASNTCTAASNERPLKVAVNVTDGLGLTPVSCRV